MPDAVQHSALVIGVLDLFHLDHLGLFEHFHSIEAMIVFRLDEMNPTEATSAEGALQQEVLLRVLALGRAFLSRLLLLRLLLGLLALRLTAIGTMGGAVTL
jgi:hypothetical protein